ncbi:PKD domain-containing protein [Flagellimonas eckloniae]|uniref:PKD domain-containing protein n=1 Tax=Flagellimonas eckloniae TaxID=346185 RepID=UPI0006DD24EB|nr:PKD domain-containing protein [Allomuricauda eckloniae]
MYINYTVRFVLPLFFLVSTLSYSQVDFEVGSLDFTNGGSVKSGTSLMFGPDGRLYVAEYRGLIKIFDIQRNGPGDYEVISEEVLTVQDIQNHNDDGTEYSDTKRETTGITVGGTSTNPVIYVSSSDFRVGGGTGGGDGDENVDTNSGTITRFTWNGASWDVVDLVRGLPRSEENHATNGLELATIGGTNYLIVASGGHTNCGSPGANFAYLTEYALSAAILSVDLDYIDALSTQVDGNGRSYKYDLPTLDDPTRDNVNGITDPDDLDYDGIDINDPFGGNDGLNQAKIVPDGPVQIFSPGYRNAYDFAITESGAVYITDNGPNGGWGGVPNNEGTALVDNDYVVGEPGGSSGTAAPDGEYASNKDHLTLVTTDMQNYTFGDFYGGHPAPIRANPSGAGLFTAPEPSGTNNAVFRTQLYDPDGSRAGSTTDSSIALPADWPPVPVGQANLVEGNYRDAEQPNPDGIDDIHVTIWDNNTNGLDEYTSSSSFGGEMQGDLIAGNSDGILFRVELNPDGSLLALTELASGLSGITNLGVTCNSDTDPFPGTIWIAPYSTEILVLEPKESVVCINQGEVGYDGSADYDSDGYTNDDEIANGTDHCNGGSRPNDFDSSIGGTLVSDLNDPDDDGDGILDADDPFQLGDPDSVGSDAFELPVENELLSGDPDLKGYDGLGMTGLMNNGAANPNWLDWIDNGIASPNPNDILGGATGLMTMQMTSGTALGGTNTQEKAFQYGVQVDQTTGIFTVSAAISNLTDPIQLYGNGSAPNGELGIYIGDGTQSDYIKFVATQSGLEGLQEIGDASQAPVSVAIATGNRPSSAITFYMVVDPSTGEVLLQYDFDASGTRTDLGTITAQGNVLQAIQQAGTDLAVGLIGTSNAPGVELEGTWEFLYVNSETPTNTEGVVGLTLVDADEDTTLFNLTDGQQIDISVIDGIGVNVVANTLPTTVGSVFFQLEGPVSNTRTENGAPYTLFGDSGGNFFPATLVEGNYILEATAYNSRGLKDGNLGSTFSIQFSIVNPTGGTNEPPVADIDASQLTGNAPLVVSLNAAGSTDDDSVIGYTWDFKDGNTSNEVSPEHTFENSGVYEVELTVEDTEGLTDTTTVSIIVEDGTGNNIPTVLYRVNAGGPGISAIDGGLDWSADEKENNSPYLLDAGSNQTAGANISNHTFGAEIDLSTTPTDIFRRSRFDGAGQSQMVYGFPIAESGEYEVRLYMCNSLSNTSEAGERIFNVELEGNLFADLTAIDLSGTYGHQVATVITHTVNVVDGTLNIEFINGPVQNPIIDGIEIVQMSGSGGGTPILVESLDNQFNTEGEELDGSLGIIASGGDGNLNFSAMGLPPGISIEPTNGQIGGSANAGTSANSPYNVTITIDDSDGESSDAKTVEFTWTIVEEPVVEEWTDKDEDESYTGRHECSFVQAGNRFYLMGGRENSQTIDVYNYTSDSWENLEDSAPLSFNHFQAVEYGGLIWVIGAFTSNGFPNEPPAEHVWMFDPSTNEWIEGPEIPASRRRGSAGLAIYNDKFYLVGGNTIGHNGGYISWFDEYDPATGTWTTLDDAPHARDHFHAVVIGNKLYAAGGRLSGGDGGTFAPTIPEVDVYDFVTGTWSTLDKDMPTPRGAPSAVNFNDKLVVIGGEVQNEEVYGELVTDALKITEQYDPATDQWTRLEDLNSERHGTQAIVSGEGIFITAGSPKIGGGENGNQKNMEFYGEDAPVGSASLASSISAPTSVFVENDSSSDLNLEVTGGSAGIFIKSMQLSGVDSNDFSIDSGNLNNVFLTPNTIQPITISSTGTGPKTATLSIDYGLSSTTDVALSSDVGPNNIPTVLYRVNAGGPGISAIDGGLDWSADEKENNSPYLLDAGSNQTAGANISNHTFGAEIDLSTTPTDIFRRSRFDGAGQSQMVYGFPIAESGEYEVRLYMCNSLSNTSEAGERIFNVELEGNLFADLTAIDLSGTYGHQVATVITHTVNVVDGTLNIEFINGPVQNPIIDGIEIVQMSGSGSGNQPPVSIATALPLTGDAPLVVNFDGSQSTDDSLITEYNWDFKDGTTSNEVSPENTFNNPGIYEVELTVRDAQGLTDSSIVTINVGDSGNEAPFVQNPGNQNSIDGETITLPIIATDNGELTYEAMGLPPGLAFNEDTGLISGTILDSQQGDGAFLESNGLVIIETESVDIIADWQQTNIGGTQGIIAQGKNYFNSQNGGTMSYDITITNAGVYRINWKSLFTGDKNSESNDSWLRFPNDTDVWFFGQQFAGNENSMITNLQGNQDNVVFPKGSSRITVETTPNGSGGNGFFKVFRSGGTSEAYKWQAVTSDSNGHKLYVWFSSPGTYTMEISERSIGHAIDRVALYKVDGPNYSDTQLDQAQESNRSGTTGGPGASANSPYNVEVTVSDDAEPPLSTTIQFDWIVDSEGQPTGQVPWMEDFQGLLNGTTSDDGITAWSSTRDSGVFSVDNNTFIVNSGSTNAGIWTSEIIALNGTVDISVDVDDLDDNKENADFIRVSYILDGGVTTLIDELRGNIDAQTVQATGISGSTLQILIESKVSFNNETYVIDNVFVDNIGAAALKINVTNFEEVQYMVLPNPGSEFIRVEGSTNEMLLQIWTMDGRRIRTVNGGTPFYIGDLNAGTYVVKTNDKKTLWFIKK